MFNHCDIWLSPDQVRIDQKGRKTIPEGPREAVRRCSNSSNIAQRRTGRWSHVLAPANVSLYVTDSLGVRGLCGATSALTECSSTAWLVTVLRRLRGVPHLHAMCMPTLGNTIKKQEITYRQQPLAAKVSCPSGPCRCANPMAGTYTALRAFVHHTNAALLFAARTPRATPATAAAAPGSGSAPGSADGAGGSGGGGSSSARRAGAVTRTLSWKGCAATASQVATTVPGSPRSCATLASCAPPAAANPQL